MDSRERAHEWVMDHEQTPYREDIDSLARLLDAHAAERIREVLTKIDEMMREVVASKRNSADEHHREGNYEEEDIYEHAGNTVQRLREQISALLKEVVSNG